MAKPPVRIAVMIPPKLRQELFDEAALARLRACGQVVLFEHDRPVTADDAKTFLRGADICLNSWGSPKFNADVVAAVDRLRLIVYCAGSVKPFVTDAVWQRGIRVTSGAAAIGVGVAEFVLGVMIVARRNAFRFADAMRAAYGQPAAGKLKDAWPAREVWNSTIGVVSLGQVGRRVVECLKPLAPGKVLAYDPHVPEEVLVKLGVERAELDDLLRRSDIITLHAPNLPETKHLIGRRELALMKDDVLIINTARGAVIDEPALVEELAKGRFYACLDVTDPEPPAADSPLRKLPNVFLTPHIAGPRTLRLGVQAADEVERFLAGQPQVYEVTKARLAITA